MAITVVTRPEQGYNLPPGNIVDAATGMIALANLPKQLQLEIQKAQLANKAAQQNIGITGQEFQWEKGHR